MNSFQSGTYLLRKLGKADSITVFVPTADSGPSAAYSFATEEGILAKTFRLHLLCSTTAIAAGSGTNLISFSWPEQSLRSLSLPLQAQGFH